MAEYIERDAALMAAMRAGCLANTVQILKDIPDADVVERKRGEWVRRGNEMKCCKCQFIYYSNHDDFNFCPNCGADMRRDN